MKYRWEYRLDERWGREWFLYADCVNAPVVVETHFQALQALGVGHPLEELLNEFFSGPMRSRVTLLPYEALTASSETLEALGRLFVGRVECLDNEVKVFGLANGNVWLHVPGDSGR